MRVDTEEFQDKILFYREHPPLHRHLTVLFTRLAGVIWNANYKKGMRKFKVKNFIPNYLKDSMTQEEKAAVATDKMRDFFEGMVNNGNR
jgi:hypothetical protein